MNLIDTVRDTIDRYRLLPSGETVVLGISGGPDSLCLLHMLRTLASLYQVSLHVGHVEHGIRGQESVADALFVQDTCDAWGIPITVQRVDVPALAKERGIAVEEAARQARYGFLGNLARSVQSNTVAVAHNADDQVETVLMHLLRGSGLAGLRGIRPLSRMDEMRLGDASPPPPQGIRLIRPMLYVPRQDIERYCAAHSLEPRFDRSNLDTTYYRNRIRHELVPTLETYNPNIRAVIGRTAEALAGDHEVLREQLTAAWATVVRCENPEAIVFDLAGLRALRDGLVRSVLREGIHRLRRTLRNINWSHVDDALRLIRRGETGSEATLPSGLALRLGYDIALLAAHDAPWPSEPRPRIGTTPVPVNLPGDTAIGENGWSLRVTVSSRENLPNGWEHSPHPLTAYVDADSLCETPVLRARQTGDWLIPLGMQGHRQKLTDLMINMKVPQQERSSVPILACGDRIVWVVGYRLDERFAVTESTDRVCAISVIAPPRK